MAKRDINGTCVEYVEQGTSDPLVLVHGSASDYRTWQSQLAEFRTQYRAIAYSRRYHWPNEPCAVRRGASRGDRGGSQVRREP